MINEFNQIISFNIKGEIYGVNADCVNGIIRVPEYTKVPKTSPELLGIINLRGEITPIIDLALKLGYEEPVNITENSRSIIVEYNNEKVAITVEEVKSVISKDAFESEDLPPVIDSKREKKYISRVIKIKKDNSLVQLLDIEKMMDIDCQIDKSSSFNNQQQQKKEETDIQHIEEEKFISFWIEDVEYAVKIDQIREILRYQDITEVPGLPNYFLGLLPLRNETIPVISARKLFKKNDKDLTDDTRILVLEINNMKIGLLVDKVSEVLSVEKKYIEDISGLFSHTNTKEVNSVIKLDKGKRILLILDSKRIFNEEELTNIISKISENQNEGEKSMENLLETKPDDIVQVVTFKVENEIYGFYIEMVQEINRYTNITKVPKTPKFIDGIINLRGEVIPLVDIRKRFDLEPKERDEFTRLIIVNIDDLKVGFIVDSVEEVLRISKDKIDNVPAVLSASIDSNFITNVVKDQNKMIMILNAQKMFSIEEYKKLEKIKESRNI
ncbi:chemotaxis protein CheW [Deferribacter abyssi]|uniref:chemotaxis protein CheW n=1 Tax=Deferribacter abyssi TaxID=213806 RepID=UPI003C20DAE5